MTVGLGEQTRINQWLLYSQKGFRSAHWNACVTPSWLVSSPRAHWITVKYHMGTLDHVIDLIVICGPSEAFYRLSSVLLTLLGAL